LGNFYGNIFIMRGLIIKTKRFYSKDIERSTWPKGIAKVRNFNKEGRDFKNVIAVLVCAENGDTSAYVRQLVKRVLDLNSQFYKLKQIVVVPFAHLSHNLAGPQIAKELIDELAALLRKEKFNVDVISFGTHKDLAFEIPGQVGEVSYFEFPYSGKKPNTN